MPTYYQAGDGLKAIKIVVTAERVDIANKRVTLTANHTGQKAVAKGEAYAYIDLPLQSVPGRVRQPS